MTFDLITLFFGLWALLTGLTYVIGALANRKYAGHFWSTLLFGLVALVIGIATFLPTYDMTSMVLLIMIGVFALIYGLTFVLLGWGIRKEVKGEWMLLLSGLFWLFLGFFIVFNLDTAGPAIAALLGLYVLMNGVIDIVTAFRAKSLNVTDTSY